MTVWLRSWVPFFYTYSQREADTEDKPKSVDQTGQLGSTDEIGNAINYSSNRDGTEEKIRKI